MQKQNSTVWRTYAIATRFRCSGGTLLRFMWTARGLDAGDLDAESIGPW